MARRGSDVDGVRPAVAPPTVAQRPAFSVDTRTWAWGDVLRWALESGRFTAVEDETREGIACLAAADLDGGLDDATVTRAAAEYRRRRRLLSAEEAEAWLHRWGIGVGAWMDYVARSVARQRVGDAAAAARAHPVGGDTVASRLWSTAVCSGAVARFGDELAARVAAQAALTGAGGATGDLQQDYERFRRHAVTARALQRQLETHALDWLRVDCEVVLCATVDAAREAVLCLRNDGMSPAEVAVQAGAEHSRRSALLEEFADELRPLLLGAAPGTVVGPAPLDGHVAVLLVTAKREPSLDDERLRALAERSVAEAALDRALGEHVRWHDLA